MTITLENVDLLEELVTYLAEQAQIEPAVWHHFLDKLAILKHHHTGMYAHSLRVGWYTCGLARDMRLVESQVRLALFGGCGHDIGKSHISNRLLNTKHMTEQKFVQIQPHAELGYQLLKDEFLMTAFVAGLHHKVRANGYGIDLEAEVPDWVADSIKASIYDITRLVCLADFFDALITRHNDKGLLTESEMTDPQAIKRVMTNYFSDNQTQITWLIANRFEPAPQAP